MAVNGAKVTAGRDSAVVCLVLLHNSNWFGGGGELEMFSGCDIGQRLGFASFFIEMGQGKGRTGYFRFNCVKMVLAVGW